MSQMMANVKDTVGEKMSQAKDTVGEKVSQAKDGLVDSAKDTGAAVMTRLEEAKQGILRLRPLKTDEHDQLEKVSKKLQADQASRGKSKKYTELIARIDGLEQKLVGMGKELTGNEVGRAADPHELQAQKCLEFARKKAELAELMPKKSSIASRTPSQRDSYFTQANVHCAQAVAEINKLKQSVEVPVKDKNVLDEEIRKSIEYFEKAVDDAAAASALKDSDINAARKSIKELWRGAIAANKDENDKKNRLADIKTLALTGRQSFNETFDDAFRKMLRADSKKKQLEHQYQRNEGITRPSEQERLQGLLLTVDEHLKARDFDDALTNLKTIEDAQNKIAKRYEGKSAWENSQSRREELIKGTNDLAGKPGGLGIAGTIRRKLDKAEDTAKSMDFKKASELLKEAESELSKAPDKLAKQAETTKLREEYSLEKDGSDAESRIKSVKAAMEQLAKKFGGEKGSDAKEYAEEYQSIVKAYNKKISSLDSKKDLDEELAQVKKKLIKLEESIVDVMKDDKKIGDLKQTFEDDKNKEWLEQQKSVALDELRKRLEEFRKDDENFKYFQDHGDDEVPLILAALKKLEDDFTKKVVDFSFDDNSKDIKKYWDSLLKDLEGTTSRVLDDMKRGLVDMVAKAKKEWDETQKKIEGLRTKLDEARTKIKDMVSTAEKAWNLIPRVEKKGLAPQVERLGEEAGLIDTMLKSGNLNTLKAAAEAIKELRKRIDETPDFFLKIATKLGEVGKNLDKEKGEKLCPSKHAELKKEFKDLAPEVARDCDQAAFDKLWVLSGKVDQLVADARSIQKTRKEAEAEIKRGKEYLDFLDKIIAGFNDGKHSRYQGKFRDRFKQARTNLKEEDPNKVSEALAELKSVCTAMLLFRNDLATGKRGKKEDLLKDQKDSLDSKAKDKEEHEQRRKAFKNRYDLLKDDLRQLRRAIAKVGGDESAIDRILVVADKAWDAYKGSLLKGGKIEPARKSLQTAETQLKTARTMTRELTAHLMGSKATRKGMISSLGPRWTKTAEDFRKEVLTMLAKLEEVVKSTDYKDSFEKKGKAALVKVADMFKADKHASLLVYLKALEKEKDPAKRRAAREKGLQVVRRYLQYVDENPIFKHLVTNPFKVRVNPGRLRKTLKDIQINMLRSV
jgi:hypothetical protein